MRIPRRYLTGGPINTIQSNITDKHMFIPHPQIAEKQLE